MPMPHNTQQPTMNRSNAPTIPNQFLKNKISEKKSIWQKNYWGHIIQNEKSYNTIVEYIENNPANWLQDKLYQKIFISVFE
jgi:REP element-mobilizing transposase RayT